MKSINQRLPISKAEVRGRSKQIKGKIRETLGRLRGNKTAQVRGKFEQAEGKTRERIARALRKTRMRL